MDLFLFCGTEGEWVPKLPRKAGKVFYALLVLAEFKFIFVNLSL
jgi:hypothetical protein